MSRTARIVVPGVAHHVTQRGVRRLQTFFGAADYARYIELLAEGCRSADVRVLAWCLMPNHVHLVLVPGTVESLTAALSYVHQRYTWIVNRRNGCTGHLWQSRFASSPMDDAHTLAAVRYVELNPVRAGLVTSPEQWRWSSLRGRLPGGHEPLAVAADAWLSHGVTDWLDFLAEGLSEEDAERIRVNARKGTVLGGAAFIARFEAGAGRTLQRRPRGRPRRDPEKVATPSLHAR
jgi:putative transposase